MKKHKLMQKLQELKIRSAWMRGVVEVAHMIIEKAEREEIKAEEIETIEDDLELADVLTQYLINIMQDIDYNIKEVEE